MLRTWKTGQFQKSFDVFAAVFVAVGIAYVVDLFIATKHYHQSLFLLKNMLSVSHNKIWNTTSLMQRDSVFSSPSWSWCGTSSEEGGSLDPHHAGPQPGISLATA